MAERVWVVYDNHTNSVVGVFTNVEAADECENMAPGDRETFEQILRRDYDEDEDNRFFEPSLDEASSPEDDEEMEEEEYDDDKFIDPGEDYSRDPYGD